MAPEPVLKSSTFTFRVCENKKKTFLFSISWKLLTHTNKCFLWSAQVLGSEGGCSLMPLESGFPAHLQASSPHSQGKTRPDPICKVILTSRPSKKLQGFKLLEDQRTNTAVIISYCPMNASFIRERQWYSTLVTAGPLSTHHVVLLAVPGSAARVKTRYELWWGNVFSVTKSPTPLLALHASLPAPLHQ